MNLCKSQSLVRGQFTTAWNGLVRVKLDKGTIAICQNRPYGIMNMSVALKGMQRFNDVGEVAQELCNDLETIFISYAAGHYQIFVFHCLQANP